MPKILIEIDTDTQVVVPKVPTLAIAEKIATKLRINFDMLSGAEQQGVLSEMATLYSAAIEAGKQPAAQATTAWQPIETAPEGVHVLVHYAKHITDLDPKWEWESDAQRTFVAMRNADYWVQDVGIGQSGIVEPTHWQPLPPAPGGE